MSKIISTEHLSDRQIDRFRELWYFVWNYMIGGAELNLDALYREQPELRPSGEITSYIEQHIGMAFETFVIFYAARIPVNVACNLIERRTNDEIPARVRVGISIFIGMLGASYLEWQHTVPDIHDSFGIILAGIWATVGFEVLNRVFSTTKKEELDKTIREAFTAEGE